MGNRNVTEIRDPKGGVLLGVEIFERYIFICKLCFRDLSIWKDLNIQPSRGIQTVDAGCGGKPINVCPHYSLIETVAKILAIKPRELLALNHFCGYFSNPIVVKKSDVFLEITSATRHPVSCCNILDYFLKRNIELAKTKNPGQFVVNGKRLSADDLSDLKEMFCSLEEFLVGQSILKFWRRVIPKILSMPASSTDEEIIKKVECFYSRLKEEVVGDDKSGFKGAVHCEIAPEYSIEQYEFKS